MIRINVLSNNKLMGCVSYDAAANLFAFNYAPDWLNASDRIALSPLLPFSPTEKSPEKHSLAVRQFFENLLPEGQALDEAAAVNNISKANLVGLMLALGKETAGALRIQMEETYAVDTPIKRHLTPSELSTRLRARPSESFSVWDGKVRLSIAGYQDKLAVFKENQDWFLVEGANLASTVILKPEPINKNLRGLPSNEFFCMRLAKNAGLPVAEVRLVHVPEPVLEVVRFDRKVEKEAGNYHVSRLAVIDACQALGLGVALKYERPYGDGKDVKNIRDGASLPLLFQFLGHSQKPAVERLRMLRWVLFQIMIGNTDAHAKNISFFSSPAGFNATPAYDLVSTLAYSNSTLNTNFAMAIGDAFNESELSAYEWANFAFACGLNPKLVAQEMKKLITKIATVLPATIAEVLNEQADAAVVHQVEIVIERMCSKYQNFVSEIPRLDKDLF